MNRASDGTIPKSFSCTPSGRAASSSSWSNIRTLKPPVRLFFGIAALLWAGLTFWLSSSPDAQGVGGFLDLSPPWDKLYHAGNFGVLAGLLYLTSGRAWLAVLLASLYGVSDEVHQSYVPGRSADALDWFADTTGATASVFLLHLFFGLRERRKPQTR